MLSSVQRKVDGYSIAMEKSARMFSLPEDKDKKKTEGPYDRPLRSGCLSLVEPEHFNYSFGADRLSSVPAVRGRI